MPNFTMSLPHDLYIKVSEDAEKEEKSVAQKIRDIVVDFYKER